MKTTGDTVFLTGASGFIGSHVLGALLEHGYNVRSLVRQRDGAMGAALGSPGPASETSGSLVTIHGDVLRAGELLDDLRGCRYLVHVAAVYSFASAERETVWETNVRGTASLLEVARIADVEKAVVTSSSATVGPATGRRPCDETNWAPLSGHRSDYHASKIEQERVALAAQLPAILVLPTAPVGPADRKPTPTGQMLVDTMRGRMFATLGGGINVVPVEDVARAHVLALDKGKAGDRYLIGGENISLAKLFSRVAEIAGRPGPRFELPYAAAYGLGLMDEIRCRLDQKARPVVPLEGVRMGRETMFVSSRKAEAELGYRAGPVSDALERAVAWFRGHGYAG
jgi:dihydroflavonol-4-reductase